MNGPMAERKRVRPESGFTLIEIIIALFILATSLVVLLGLQSAILNQSISDRNRVEAMLIARRVLAAIESSTEPIENQTLNGTATEIMAKFVEVDSEDQDLKGRADNLSGTLVVEDWAVNENPTALKRITLSLAWSGNAIDVVTVYYFIPNDQEDLDKLEAEENAQQ